MVNHALGFTSIDYSRNFWMNHLKNNNLIPLALRLGYKKGGLILWQQ